MSGASDNPPRVSVVMTVREPDPGYFADAVASVLGQTFGDFELVILENPPHGGVAQVLERFPDPRIRHVRNGEDESLSASRNRALGLARADLVALLDADDVCAPERLQRQYEFLENHPEVAVVGSQLEVIDDRGGSLGYRSYPTAHEAIVRAMRRYNPIAQPSVMARAGAMRGAGGYRAEYKGTCEDYDLWSRMALAGHRFANVTRPLLRYRMHAASTKTSRLRANLRDTLMIKRRYWSSDMVLRDKLRALGERCLLLLPGGMVTALFRRLVLRPRLSAREG